MAWNPIKIALLKEKKEIKGLLGKLDRNFRMGPLFVKKSLNPRFFPGPINKPNLTPRGLE